MQFLYYVHVILKNPSQNMAKRITNRNRLPNKIKQINFDEKYIQNLTLSAELYHVHSLILIQSI